MCVLGGSLITLIIHLNIATCQGWFPLYVGVEKATCFKRAGKMIFF